MKTFHKHPPLDLGHCLRDVIRPPKNWLVLGQLLVSCWSVGDGFVGELDVSRLLIDRSVSCMVGRLLVGRSVSQSVVSHSVVGWQVGRPVGCWSVAQSVTIVGRLDVGLVCWSVGQSGNFFIYLHFILGQFKL